MLVPPGGFRQVNTALLSNYPFYKMCLSSKSVEVVAWYDITLSFSLVSVLSRKEFIKIRRIVWENRYKEALVQKQQNEKD